MQQLGYQSQLQPFSYTAGFFTEMSGQNVVATLMPSHPVKAHVILTAHYDHLGKQGDSLYAGANDNASGVSALLFLAAQFAETILPFQISFVATDAEENGLHGAKFFVSQLPPDDSVTILNINLDMLAVSRADKTLYAFTSYAQRHALQSQLSAITSDTIKIKVTSSANTMNRLNQGSNIDWRRASDHYAFAKAGFAYIYFGMGYDPHHHQRSDLLSNIDQNLYIEAVNYITQFIQQLDMTKLTEAAQ
ncbi:MULTISPECIES: M28 family peptidase [unclassified Pseudoalteromonas]|uniref:M28 family peptidase n=1 Tax=unclassified Pseudoalteromonas TaxID=194690 RepID=UPI001FCBDD2B|nr:MULTISPECIES: M28 family peptidase [unclassified Pseudoalteromonas]BDF94961.1 hypothetical protein KAN5_17990 [Pseudoalteromonas sp. KAN5]